MKQETIKVKHDTGDKNNTDVNEKQLNYGWNKYSVSVDIAGDGHYYQGMWIELMHEDCEEGFKVRVKEKNGKLYLSLDADGGRIETEERDYWGWIKLEQIQKALKLIGGVFK